MVKTLKYTSEQYNTFKSIDLTTVSRVKTVRKANNSTLSKSKMTAVCYAPNFLLKYLIDIFITTMPACWGYINKTCCWGNKIIFSVN